MLSLVQKKILKLLAINCRYTNKDIAQAIGMSEDIVRYHIEKLIEKEKMSHFTAFFDFKHVGMYHHHYLIRLKDISQNMIAELTRIKEIFFINTSSGSYDLQLIIAHKDDEELLAIKQQIDFLLKDNIADSMMLKFYVQYKWSNVLPVYDVAIKKPSNKKNPVYKLNREDWHQQSSDIMPPLKITEAEKKTIKALIKDPRASYTQISRQTDQSIESVRQQIYRFVEKEYIGSFGIFPDMHKYGYFTSCIMLNIQGLERAKLQSYIQS